MTQRHRAIGDEMRGRKISLVMIALSVVLVGCGDETPLAEEGSPTPSASSTQNGYEGWQVYTSTWERLTFRYPPTWKLATLPLIDTEEGEHIELMSPRGFTVRWSAPLSGVGGGCDAETAPHVIFERLIPLNVAATKNPLFAVVASVERVKSVAVVDDRTVLRGFKEGDTGACLVYPTFTSKFHDEARIQLNVGHLSVQLGNGAPPPDGSEKMTVEEYVQQPDVAAAVMIFQSIEYA